MYASQTLYISLIVLLIYFYMYLITPLYIQYINIFTACLITWLFLVTQMFC